MGIETAIIASAVVGAGTSLYGASKQAGAAKDAAKIQQRANDQAIQFQREQRDIATQSLTPYVNRGNAAFALMAPHLGMGGGPPSAANGQAPMPSTGLGTSSREQARTYMSSNPDVMAAFRRGGFGNMNLEQAAEYHMQTYGIAEGRPGMPSQSAPAPGVSSDMAEYQTPGQAQEEAWNKYRTETTYGKIGDYYAQKAGKEFMDLAGSSGSALSGRTARGMAEVGNEAAMANFQGYMGMLGGINDQGYNATTGIASAGQNFANNASQLTQASGQAAAAGKIGAANAWQSGLSDLAGWGGWAAGQLYKPQGAGVS